MLTVINPNNKMIVLAHIGDSMDISNNHKHHEYDRE